MSNLKNFQIDILQKLFKFNQIVVIEVCLNFYKQTCIKFTEIQSLIDFIQNDCDKIFQIIQFLEFSDKQFLEMLIDYYNTKKQFHVTDKLNSSCVKAQYLFDNTFLSFVFLYMQNVMRFKTISQNILNFLFVILEKYQFNCNPSILSWLIYIIFKL